MSADLIRIIGIGNPLMADDGLGIKVIQLLQQHELPASVELVDGGCGGLKLLPLLTGCRRLILVDAADFNAAPGDVRILTNTDLHQIPLPSSRQIGHQFGLSEVLHVAQKMDRLPPLTIYLMQALSCHPDTSISVEIEAALPSLSKTIIRSLSPT